MRKNVTFYFDFASPYGYLAATQMDQLAADTGCDVVWRPILLGVVFRATGSAPNLQRPLVGDYLLRDVPRFARRLGVELHLPMPSPFASLAAARAVYWAEQRDPHLASSLAKAVFAAHWAEGRDMALPENVLDVAASLDINRDDLDSGMQDPAVKDRLRRETDSAIARGVFGSPFFLVGDEPFWGVDRLPQVADWLRTGGW
ncbi:2-hydroxychromene-2-carboxylate isomerase [Aerophototrophica crusticola]|uniref:2-hydroxychromene-2-carboxylate isomerase n=1 Tax=Aerophototrophica crusticola TaxID=1709002 RepID=A0A858R4Q4_9PROT|nr:2-hydroxychromene-2-carboxylate isomerase [Rhodospirillaceae bacterium B3]